MGRYGWRLGVLFGFLALMTGCATAERSPLTAFYQYDYGFAVDGFRKSVQTTKANDEKNVVLAYMNYGGAGFVGGDYRSVEDAFGEASKIMDDVEHGSGRGVASTVLAHDLRVYKGEPYERAMAYTYLGLAYFRRGEYENARSAFNLALLADQSSKGSSEDYRNDFALAHYLIGKTYIRLKEMDNAKISFETAKKYMPDNVFAELGKQQESNFTLLVEMGCGPYKTPDAIVGTVDVIRSCEYAERYAEVYVNGSFVGRTGKLLDVNYQAKTSGTSARDAVQVVKGVARAAVGFIPVFGSLAGAAMDLSGMSRADIRTWYMMPGEVQVIEAALPEGSHTVQVKFFDEKGKELERFEQMHYFVPVGGAGRESAPEESIFIIRSGLDRHNTLRPKAAQYLTAPLAAKNQ